MSHSKPLLNKMISSFFSWSTGNSVTETQDVPVDLELIATIFQGLGYKIKNADAEDLKQEANRMIIVMCGKSSQKLILYKETDYCNCKHEDSNAYWEVTTSKSSPNLVASGSSIVPPPPSNISCFIKSFALFLGTAVRRETFRGRLSLPTSSERSLDSKCDNDFPVSFTPNRYRSLDGLNGYVLTPAPPSPIYTRSVSQQENSTLRPRLGSDASSVSSISTCGRKEDAEEVISNKTRIVGYLEAAIKLLNPTKDSSSTVVNTKVAMRRCVSNAEVNPANSKRSTAKGKDPVPEATRKVIPRGAGKYAHVKSTIPKAAVAPRIPKK